MNVTERVRKIGTLVTPQKYEFINWVGEAISEIQAKFKKQLLATFSKTGWDLDPMYDSSDHLFLKHVIQKEQVTTLLSKSDCVCMFFIVSKEQNFWRSRFLRKSYWRQFDRYANPKVLQKRSCNSKIFGRNNQEISATNSWNY